MGDYNMGNDRYNRKMPLLLELLGIGCAIACCGGYLSANSGADQHIQSENGEPINCSHYVSEKIKQCAQKGGWRYIIDVGVVSADKTLLKQDCLDFKLDTLELLTTDKEFPGPLPTENSVDGILNVHWGQNGLNMEYDGSQ